MDSLTERLRRIADRLARLRGAGAERFGRAHGVSSHHFMLFAPMSEAELRAFEREHGVELVPEHRAFLAALGTGAGPAYGILPLRDALRGPAPEPNNEATFLRTPFPHRTAPTLASAAEGTISTFCSATRAPGRSARRAAADSCSWS